MIITLATLPQATEQQIFDQVATHLLTQMKQSRREAYAQQQGNCLYRHNGLKCAAGALIGDDEYKPCMDEAKGALIDGTGWQDLVVAGIVPKEHQQFISILQQLHDGYDPNMWYEQLYEFAELRGLNTNVLDGF